MAKAKNIHREKYTEKYNGARRKPMLPDAIVYSVRNSEADWRVIHRDYDKT